VRKGRLLDPGRQVRINIEKSRKQEGRVAGQIGGKRTPGSGNQWHSKGDVQSGTLQVENKRTDTGRYTLKSVELRKYRLLAVKAGKRFVMQVDLSEDPRDHYILIPVEDFKE
jgi:hypothetical protein